MEFALLEYDDFVLMTTLLFQEKKSLMLSLFIICQWRKKLLLVITHMIIL